MNPLRFAARVRMAFLAALVAVAGAATAVAYWSSSPEIVLAATLAAGITVGFWLLARVLTPATRTLDALRDGVRGYKDHDFSLNLAADRHDEIGELVELYNAVGDVLRQERGNLLQRELLLETVLEATPMAIVLTQRDRIFLVNRAARELFVTGRRLEGQPFDRILEDCPPQMREALASGRDALFSVEQG
ncbi:MAG TPA: PAS domain-containing protein, partial [Thermoanaerobaculia bacterium]|nr:PAS domain-containing protein [Thermoanaerobaculia bacterium]